VLEVVCGSQTPHCLSFVQDKLNVLKQLLVDGLQKAASSSKAPRLRCMEQVLVQLSSNESTKATAVEFIKEILPEVILCTQGAKRCREAGFNLLVTCAKSFIKCSDANGEAHALIEFFEQIFLGLSGSPVTITATIFALSRLVYEFRDTIPEDLLSQVIQNVCLLLGCNTREVCKAALGFILVLFTILDRSTLAQFTKDILDALMSWKPETRRHFRFRVKKILQRLVRKFGYDTILAMTPAEHKKQLQNIHKTENRLKRKKAESSKSVRGLEDDLGSMGLKQTKETVDEILEDSSDSDMSDEDERDVGAAAKNRKKRSSAAWLQDSEQEPMDLLDPSASHSIMAVNPEARKPKKNVSFKTSSDGRLLISEAGDDSGDEDDDTKKLLSSIGISSKPSLRPKPSRQEKVAESDDEDDFDDDTSTKMSYKPGGSGIHRDLYGAATDGSKYKSKKAKGDVKKHGAHDPYAYVPLNIGIMNKRKRKKMTGQYNSLMQSAKKGARKGGKMKAKLARMAK